MLSFVSPSKLLSSIIIPLWVISNFPAPVSAVDQRHRDCSAPFRCGNRTDLRYPFWRQGRYQYCGHPGFELDCSGDSAEINITSVTYKILDVNQSSNILKLVRKDYIDTLCPSNPLNTTLNSSFAFANDTTLVTLFYDCPPPSTGVNPLSLRYVGDIGCGEDDRGRDYYVARNLSSPLPDNENYLISNAFAACRTNVSVPASESELSAIENGREDLQAALDGGFELNWVLPNDKCNECMSSGGACGFNWDLNRFTCYCADKPYDTACGKVNAGLSRAAIIGISVACGAVAIVLIIGGLFLFFLRRRKKTAAQYRSMDLSTPPSSKGPSATSTSVSRSIASFTSSKSDLTRGNSLIGVQVFSYAELEEATGNFSRELGDGGFGTVYYGVLRDGRAVAVKRLYESTLKRVEQFKNEIEILKTLKHPNLVNLYGCTSRHSRELLLVYEYISNGTVAEHLHGDRAKSHFLAWPVRLNIAIETAGALSYLHASGIIHRDVKTTNILLDNKFQVKVADFGLSRLFPTDVTHVSTAPQGTPGYVDPEYYQCYRLNEKSDVYSFGVVLVELISSKEAVDITRHRHDINLANMAINRIQNDSLDELVDPSLGFQTDLPVRRMIMSVAELAFRCLQQEREIRPSMDEVLEILKGIQKAELGGDKAEVVDIRADDVGLLKHTPPPVSPETDKWGSSSNTTISSF